jgi:hypothetical protein
VIAAGLLSAYTFVTLQGPHGLGELREKLARIQQQREHQANLRRMIADKQKRVDSLSRGQNIEMEMRRYGRTLPDEIEYKVPEPAIPDPPDDGQDLN